MTPEQQASIDQITRRPEYEPLKKMLPKLLEQYKDAEIAVFDFGHKVFFVPEPGVYAVELANAGGMSPELRVVSNLEFATHLCKTHIKIRNAGDCSGFGGRQDSHG